MPEQGWDDIVLVAQKEKNFTPFVKSVVKGDTGAISMVSENLGVYIISEMQTKFLPDNVVIKDFDECVFRTMGYGTKPLKSVPPAVKEFVKMLKHLNANKAE